MKWKEEEFLGYFIIFIIKLPIYHSILLTNHIFMGINVKTNIFRFILFENQTRERICFLFLSFLHPNTHGWKHFLFSFSLPWCFLSYSLSLDATKHNLNEHDSRHPPIIVVMTPSMPHLEKMEEILVVWSNGLYINSYQKLPRKDIKRNSKRLLCLRFWY